MNSEALPELLEEMGELARAIRKRTGLLDTIRPGSRMKVWN